MTLKQFAQSFVKEAHWMPSVRGAQFLVKLLKGALVAGGGAAAGAAAVHAVDKKHEKKTAKKFYWLGRNTGN